MCQKKWPKVEGMMECLEEFLNAHKMNAKKILKDKATKKDFRSVKLMQQIFLLGTVA